MYPVVKFATKDPKNFFRTLNQRVNEYFKSNGITKKGNEKLHFKTFVMLAFYLVPYFLLLFIPMPSLLVIGLYLVMGVGLAGLGLCVMHDAIHGAYSQWPWLNRVAAFSMNLIGGSPFTWKIQHNVLHHSYTNIYHLDEDIDDKPFLRLSPEGKLKRYHKVQHWYALPLYSLATISWILMKDFKQLATYNRTGMTKKHGFSPVTETIKMILGKGLYVFFIIAVPILAGLSWWAVIIGFVLMHMLAGLYITIVFQLAHVVEGPNHHAPPEDGNMEDTWAIHQLKSTANFACNNRLVTWLVGGLNFQIEHHLFPNISHVHYRNIAKIVKKTAKEFNLPYYEHEKFRGAVRSHLKVLKLLGKGAALA